jgi:dethiobiotin synthetase
LRKEKIHALAMKPFCTGDRNDLEILQKIQMGEISDLEMNPYFFPEPIAPFLAARRRRQKICLHDVLEKISNVKARCDVLLVEGVGGVMVPLGADFMVRDLIANLRCPVILAAKNQLGTINHTLMSVAALQDVLLQDLTVALIDQEKHDFSAQFNQSVLVENLNSTRVFKIPFLSRRPLSNEAFEQSYKKIKKTLAAILKRG